MKSNLFTNGNSWHLYIGKDIAKLLGISREKRIVKLDIENQILRVEHINEDINDAFCKKLILRSSGFGLSLTKPILGLLEINPETDMVDCRINGRILYIKKAE